VQNFIISMTPASFKVTVQQVQEFHSSYLLKYLGAVQAFRWFRDWDTTWTGL